MAYTKGKKSQAVILLMTSNWNFKEVSKKTGIPEITLRTWGNEQREIEEFKGSQNYKNNTKKNLPIPEMLEETIKKMLEMIPENWNGQAWGVAVGILMDKWLLTNGESTSRNESIIRGLKEVSPDDRDAVIQEAERILAEGASRRTASGESSTD